MLKHPEITERRIEQFLKDFLPPHIYGESSPLKVEFCADAHQNQQQASTGKFQYIEPGFKWGPPYRMVWFRATGSIPRSWVGKTVIAKLELGGERTIWKGNSPIWGLDYGHPDYRIAKAAKGGEKIEIYVQAYGGNPQVRVHGRMDALPALPFEYKLAELLTFDNELFQFKLDLEFAFRLMKALPPNDVARAHLMFGLNEALNVFDIAKPETWLSANRIIKDALSPKRVDRYHTLTPVGHAHLDTAWLWPLGITHLKMAHTAAIQLALMEQYPEYVFCHSQPEQYQWLEHEYPKLFERLKDKVAAGQWEPVGSMWVETDANMAGAESLVRQILYGKRYFLKKFNVETKDLWLPDTFGFCAQLPQIMAKSGIEYFLTQKISWNQFNKFPHNTFWWEGLDGSRIWSHFPPANTYTGMADPEQVLQHLTQNKDAGRNDHGLYIFGYGDGGGGPTTEMLESLRRCARAPAMPVFEWKRASEFFEEAKAKSRDLPVWVGEIYLELHRGTYTTQANTKKFNRQCEFLLRDLEWLSCFLAAGGIQEYPAKKIESLWKTVLLHQFHDILPGSSVREVYEEVEEDYKQVVQTCEKMIDDSIQKIAENLDRNKNKPIAVFTSANVSTEARAKPPKGETPQSIICNGQSLPVQLIEEFGEKYLIFQTPEAALEAVAIAEWSKSPPAVIPKLRAKSRKIENELFAVRFDTNGNITSVQSKEDETEFIEQGSLANMFQLFEDRPTSWSAWDIDVFSHETQKDLVKSERFEIVERGPVRTAIEIEKKFGNSRILQRISLGPTHGIRFDTQIDWYEDEKMLKVAFPVNVHTHKAAFETQFGFVERPTHKNTSWEIAKFEVPHQKWIDLSEGDMGVALLNDGKYGCDVYKNVMRLTLLRSPKAPDLYADMGTHRFTYVLLPHFGTFHWANVVHAAYALNAPVRVVPVPRGGGTTEFMNRFVSCDDRNIIIESVKKAEDSSSIIVRLYECHQTRGKAELYCSAKIKSCAVCDLLENELQQIEVSSNAVQFEYRPFEIITLKLTL